MTSPDTPSKLTNTPEEEDLSSDNIFYIPDSKELDEDFFKSKTSSIVYHDETAPDFTSYHELKVRISEKM